MNERTAETRWLVERGEIGDEARPLEMRTYKARRGLPDGTWASVSRRYDVRGLYNLFRTSGASPVWSDGEERDVQAYEARVRARNKQLVKEH